MRGRDRCWHCILSVRGAPAANSPSAARRDVCSSAPAWHTTREALRGALRRACTAAAGAGRQSGGEGLLPTTRRTAITA